MKCFDDATTDGADATVTRNIGNMNRVIQHPSVSINTRPVVIVPSTHWSTFHQQNVTILESWISIIGTLWREKTCRYLKHAQNSSQAVVKKPTYSEPWITHRSIQPNVVVRPHCRWKKILHRKRWNVWEAACPSCKTLSWHGLAIGSSSPVRTAHTTVLTTVYNCEPSQKNIICFKGSCTCQNNNRPFN